MQQNHMGKEHKHGDQLLLVLTLYILSTSTWGKRELKIQELSHEEKKRFIGERLMIL